MIPAITSPGHRDCVTRVSACDFQEAPLSLSSEQAGVNISIKHQSRVLGQKLRSAQTVTGVREPHGEL